jgi:hypothetical protein
LEDPGKLCMIGYSSGQRSAAQFDWVRNLRRKTSAEDQQKLDYQSSSCFALFWNMLKNRAPPSVIDDTTAFFSGLGVYRMDANKQAPAAAGKAFSMHWDSATTSSNGKYTIMVDNVPIQFHDVELAPPAGVFGVNYARHIHTEGHPHKYALAWTAMRALGNNDGGHFFLSRHRIRVQSAANTLVIWPPELEHGTSLQNVQPNETTVFQAGMSIVTSHRMAATWNRYVNDNFSTKNIDIRDVISEEV